MTVKEKYNRRAKLVLLAASISGLIFLNSCAVDFCSAYANSRQRQNFAKEQYRDNKRSYIPSPLTANYRSVAVKGKKN